MDEGADWVGPIRALLYPVQFEPAPSDGVERVLRTVVRAGALGATPGQYLAAIRAALASRGELARLERCLAAAARAEQGQRAPAAARPAAAHPISSTRRIVAQLSRPMRSTATPTGDASPPPRGGAAGTTASLRTSTRMLWPGARSSAPRSSAAVRQAPSAATAPSARPSTTMSTPPAGGAPRGRMPLRRIVRRAAPPGGTVRRTRPCPLVQRKSVGACPSGA